MGNRFAIAGEVTLHSQDHQSRHGADHDRIDKRAQHSHAALLLRIIGLRDCVRDWCRTLTCLVREQSACHTGPDCQRNRCTDKAAGRCLRIERPVEDQAECGRNV